MAPAETSQFWDKKIADWELKRYRKSTSPIARRADFTRQVLRQMALGKSVVDLGCGTGQLFRGLDAASFSALHGVDFSTQAIAIAKSNFWPENVRFFQSDVTAFDFKPYQMVVGLGLLDWLSDQQIATLTKGLKGRKFLFSFSNKAAWRQRLLHSAYVNCAYGWRTAGYVPRYFWAHALSRHFAGALEHIPDLHFSYLPDHPLVGFVMHL